jgi:hypothetical protein
MLLFGGYNVCTGPFSENNLDPSPVLGQNIATATHRGLGTELNVQAEEDEVGGTCSANEGEARLQVIGGKARRKETTGKTKK